MYVVAGVKLHKSGWALLVADAKVFIWRYSTHQLSVCNSMSVIFSLTNYVCNNSLLPMYVCNILSYLCMYIIFSLTYVSM